MAQFKNRNEFPPCFSCRKVIPCLFLYTLPVLAIRQKKCVCGIEHQSVCVLLLVPILLARVQTMSMCPRTTTLEAGDAATRNAAMWLLLAQHSQSLLPRFSPPSRPGTQPLVMLLCGFLWRSTRSHYLLVLVMRALATCISMNVRTYRHSIITCTTMIPTAVP